jgi:SpoVK/Ycf46/Vps4 family AAA+-type ATPase
VSADALGFLLTWLQDRPEDSEAFVCITANDATKLPPELLRKGRFDEVFWVGFPNRDERKAVMAATLRKHNRTEVIDLDRVADATNHFTGAEIAELIPDVLRTAFYDGARPIATDDIIAAAKDCVPLYDSRGKDMDKLQRELRARPASLPSVEDLPSGDTDGPVINLS